MVSGVSGVFASTTRRIRPSSVTQTLPFAGPLNIQCRVVNGEPTVFEINPRFSGGIPLTIAAGADFPRYLVDLALGRPVPARIGRFRDQLRELSTRTQFILITHNRATIEVAAAIYGISLGADTASRVLSLRLEQVPLAA